MAKPASRHGKWDLDISMAANTFVFFFSVLGATLWDTGIHWAGNGQRMDKWIGLDTPKLLLATDVNFVIRFSLVPIPFSSSFTS